MDFFDKYKEDKVPHELLYVLARIGLFVAVNVFAIFASRILCSVISTILGICFKTKFVVLKLIPFINSSTTISAVGFLILLGIMLRLFWDDGKRHTAYQRFSMPVVTVAVVFMFLVYSIPTIFLEDAKDSLAAGIKSFYKPCMWLTKYFDGSIQIPVVISTGIICILCMIIYKLSGDRYLTKHPDADVDYIEHFDDEEKTDSNQDVDV